MRVVERDFPIALLGRVVSGAARMVWELENGDSDGRRRVIVTEGGREDIRDVGRAEKDGWFCGEEERRC